MGRCLVVAFLGMTLAAYGQRQMSVPDLVTFIKSSIQMHNDDRAVADDGAPPQADESPGCGNRGGSARPGRGSADARGAAGADHHQRESSGRRPGRAASSAGRDSIAESGRAERDPGGDHGKSARLHQEPAQLYLRASHHAQFRSVRDGILAPGRQNPGAAQLRGRQGRLQGRSGEQSAGGEHEARAVGRHHFLGRVRNHAVPDLHSPDADAIRLGTLGHAARQADVRVQLPCGAAQFGLQHLSPAFGPHHRGRISRADLRRRGHQADHADQDGLRRPGGLPDQPGFA